MASCVRPVSSVPNHLVVLVGQGGHNAVALLVQMAVGLLDRGVLVVVDPLGAAHGHVASGVEGVVGLHHVHVLYPEAVARAQHGRGVVALVDVLEHHADVASAQGCQTVEEGALVVAEESGGFFVEVFFLLEA